LGGVGSGKRKSPIQPTVSTTEKDLGMDRILKELKLIDGSYTKVGFPGGAVGATVIMKAAVNEFGTINGKVPSRPFMRQTFEDPTVQAQLGALRATMLNGIYAGTMTVKTALGRIGEFYTGAIKRKITTGNFRALSPRTIAAKGSTRPLIDSGQMRNAVTHIEVVK
jgi:hypothetical protein